MSDLNTAEEDIRQFLRMMGAELVVLGLITLLVYYGFLDLDMALLCSIGPILVFPFQMIGIVLMIQRYMYCRHRAKLHWKSMSDS